jgi:competence protein ComFB
LLVNIMEEAVVEMLDGVLSLYDVCKCENCIRDITALALNRLPPRYVVRPSGASLTRFILSREQERADVTAAITQAVEVVSKNPRHDARGRRV